MLSSFLMTTFLMTLNMIQFHLQVPVRTCSYSTGVYCNEEAQVGTDRRTYSIYVNNTARLQR